MMARKRGMMSTLNVMVLLVLFLLIVTGLTLAIKSNILDDLVKKWDVEIGKNVPENSRELLDTDENNFKTGVLDVFDVTLDYDVDEVTYFALNFEKGWGALTGNGWLLDSWRVTCSNGAEEYELMRYSTTQWIQDNKILAKMSNEGYKEGLDCGNTVKVYILTGTEGWSGTDGTAYLIYSKSTEE